MRERGGERKRGRETERGGQRQREEESGKEKSESPILQSFHIGRLNGKNLVVSPLKTHTSVKR